MRLIQFACNQGSNLRCTSEHTRVPSEVGSVRTNYFTLIWQFNVMASYRFAIEICTDDVDPTAPSPDRQAHRLPIFSGVTYTSGMLAVIVRGRWKYFRFSWAFSVLRQWTAGPEAIRHAYWVALNVPLPLTSTQQACRLICLCTLPWVRSFLRLRLLPLHATQSY